MKNLKEIMIERTTGHLTSVIRDIRQRLTKASGDIASLQRELKPEAKKLKKAEGLVDQARQILFDLQ